MNTNLYLFNASFRHSFSITIDDLVCAIERLVGAYELARSNFDRIYRNDLIYNELIYSTSRVYEVLYEDHLPLTRDHRRALMKIIDHSTPTILTEQEQVDILVEHSDSDIYGFLCLYNIKKDTINEYYIICKDVDWYFFHRTFLGMHPVSESHFYSECKKFFPALFFHDRVEACLRTLEGGLISFSKSIVHHLVQLNDHYSSYHIIGNRMESLRLFSSACGIEVTPEGNALRKAYFTFQFIAQDSTVVNVCCEPHAKLSRSDNQGDTHHYNNRIYFHEGKDNIHEGKVLIGHIGGHL